MSDRKVNGDFPSPKLCRFSPHREVVLHPMSLPGALDGLYLLCVDRMLEACWVGVVNN